MSGRASLLGGEVVSNVIGRIGGEDEDSRMRRIMKRRASTRKQQSTGPIIRHIHWSQAVSKVKVAYIFEGLILNPKNQTPSEQERKQAYGIGKDGIPPRRTQDP